MNPCLRPAAIAALSLACAALPGCGPVDPCGGQAGACVGVVLVGDVGALTGIQLEMSGAVTHRITPKFANGQEHLPVAVPVLVSQTAAGTLSIVALGLQSGVVAALGRAQVTLVAGGHQRVEVPMAVVPGPSCSDKALDGAETDIDCGGGKCPLCAEGRSCKAGTDCMTGVCAGGRCMKATCTDQAKNQGETDVDCGGSCPPCDDMKACAGGADCKSGVCDPMAKICNASMCTDMVKNAGETDVDCGGLDCPPCDDGKACLASSDCASRLCTMEMCQMATCTDLVKNGLETDVDCGGGACPRCDDNLMCKAESDCKSGVCDRTQNTCTPPTCGDAVKNGQETDVDCGGPDCKPCPTGKGCLMPRDCRDLVCRNGACQAPTCSDGQKNGNETDVDCGGGVCAKCVSGKACLVNADCQGASCVSGKCK